MALPDGYSELLSEIKQAIQTARLRAALSVNRELLGLYWWIGHHLIERQAEAGGWGAGIVTRLAADLRAEFPQQTGFSERNLWYMQALAKEYPESDFAELPVAQVPWGHVMVLLDRASERSVRDWYAAKATEQGWSRSILLNQIKSRAHERQAAALTNYPLILPAATSELAHQLMKNPYNLDFLTLREDAAERELENAILDHLQKFMLELGRGFAFVGRQYPLTVEGQEFFIDLLFYHLKLRCFFVIDLKIEEFKPEFSGKMGFYLEAVNQQVADAALDGPTLGLVLCAGLNKTVVEYALRATAAPVAVASYTYTKALPPALQPQLPSPAELQEVVDRTVEEVETTSGSEPADEDVTAQD